MALTQLGWLHSHPLGPFIWILFICLPPVCVSSSSSLFRPSLHLLCFASGSCLAMSLDL